MDLTISSLDMILSLSKMRDKTLGHVVLGPISALGNTPVDILGGYFDVAGLTVNAVLAVDVELHSERSCVVFNILVNTRRTKLLLNALVFGPRKPCVFFVILVGDSQVTRFVLLVVSACSGHRGQDVKSEFPIWLRVLDRLKRPSFLSGLSVSVMVSKGPGLSTLGDKSSESRVD